ncbi:hypothetical protein SETIT_2G116200v2 [Setaria italica]|uniref:BPM/SPOP BACK domain-containing protein n=1 Tax=Setaria italica TaxID=4555 RepID=A0A368PY06_SETIT|nr:hypothetical protein SETIT_2G116200v2 [Setaria italica]
MGDGEFHKWEIHLRSKDHWASRYRPVTLKIVLLSEPRAGNNVKAKLGCRLVDPAGRLPPSEEKSVAHKFIAAEGRRPHKALLAARSPVFKAKLFRGMKEYVKVENMEPAVFKALACGGGSPAVAAKPRRGGSRAAGAVRAARLVPARARSRSGGPAAPRRPASRRRLGGGGASAAGRGRLARCASARGACTRSRARCTQGPRSGGPAAGGRATAYWPPSDPASTRRPTGRPDEHAATVLPSKSCARHFADTVPELDRLEGEEAAAMAQHLLAGADRYGLDRLKLICEWKLSDCVTVGTAATTLALAEQHYCPQLKERCLDAVLETEGYKHLKASCPSVLTDLLKAARGSGTN